MLSTIVSVLLGALTLLVTYFFNSSPYMATTNEPRALSPWADAPVKLVSTPMSLTKRVRFPSFPGCMCSPS